jgi:hypothetical protein
VTVTVGTFLERLRKMEAGEAGYGERGPAARQVLAERGLDEATVRETEAVIARIQSIREEARPNPGPDDRQEAERMLWGWYLEWSAIARVAVRDRRLLRALGFLNTTRLGADVDEIAPLELDADPDQTPAERALPAPPPAETDPATATEVLHAAAE